MIIIIKFNKEYSINKGSRLTEAIENILVLLEDGGTYSKDSISQKSRIPQHYVEEIINFLRHFELVEADEPMEKIRLTREFLEFLYKVK